jgi:hypothetical protein
MKNPISRLLQYRERRKIEHHVAQRREQEAKSQREAAEMKGKAKACQSVIRNYYIAKFALTPGEKEVLRSARLATGVKVREGPKLDAAKSLAGKGMLAAAGTRGLVHAFHLTEGGDCYRKVQHDKHNLPICLPTKCNGKKRAEESSSYSSYNPYEH